MMYEECLIQKVDKPLPKLNTKKREKVYSTNIKNKPWGITTDPWTLKRWSSYTMNNSTQQIQSPKWSGPALERQSAKTHTRRNRWRNRPTSIKQI